MRIPTITIVGAGAIGGVIGHALACSGNDVILVDADPEHVKAIASNGLVVRDASGSKSCRIRAFHTGELPDDLRMETTLLCVKALHTRAALETIAPRLAQEGFVVSIQNGLQEPIIAEYVGQERTVGAFVNLFADKTAPGEISYGGTGTLTIGEVDGTISPRVQDLVYRLQAWGPAKATENILGYLWSKLAYGAMLIATATTNETISDLFADHRFREPLLGLATEVLAVAASQGVTPEPFDDWDPSAVYGPTSTVTAADVMMNRVVERLRTYTKTRTGVWRDLAVHHRKTEVGSHYAPVIDLATRCGIEVRGVKWLVNTITAIEAGETGLDATNLVGLSVVIS